jgi:hypothetical protein
MGGVAQGYPLKLVPDSKEAGSSALPVPKNSCEEWYIHVAVPGSPKTHGCMIHVLPSWSALCFLIRE